MKIGTCNFCQKQSNNKLGVVIQQKKKLSTNKTCNKLVLEPSKCLYSLSKCKRGTKQSPNACKQKKPTPTIVTKNYKQKIINSNFANKTHKKLQNTKKIRRNPVYYVKRLNDKKKRNNNHKKAAQSSTNAKQKT